MGEKTFLMKVCGKKKNAQYTRLYFNLPATSRTGKKRISYIDFYCVPFSYELCFLMTNGTRLLDTSNKLGNTVL